MHDVLKRLYSLEEERLVSLLEDTHAPLGKYDSPVFGEGDDKARIMFIGEAPGKEEASLGRPFVGKAGKQLDNLLTLGSINREQVFVTNTVKYRPMTKTERGYKNRTPSVKEVKDGLTLLSQEVCIVCPEIIVTLGNVPLRAICSIASICAPKISDVHGQIISITVEERGIKLYPMYHPASTIYDRSLLPLCEEDAKRLGAL